MVIDGCNHYSSVLFYVVLELLYRCVNVVFNVGMSFSPSFLDTYSLSMSSLGCNALCAVISFLALLSICLSSSLLHFKNVPEYLTRRTAQVLIPLIRFLLYSFISSSFLVLQRYSFLIFSFISICLMVSVSYIPKYLSVSFCSSVLIFS